jgi:hypothetical protein
LSRRKIRVAADVPIPKKHHEALNFLQKLLKKQQEEKRAKKKSKGSFVPETKKMKSGKDGFSTTVPQPDVSANKDGMSPIV